MMDLFQAYFSSYGPHSSPYEILGNFKTLDAIKNSRCSWCREKVYYDDSHVSVCHKCLQLSCEYCSTHRHPITWTKDNPKPDGQVTTCPWCGIFIRHGSIEDFKEELFAPYDYNKPKPKRKAKKVVKKARKKVGRARQPVRRSPLVYDTISTST